MIRPLGAYVLVQRKGSEEKLGQIIVPDSAKKAKDEGTVIARGPDAVEVEAGDKGLFQRYAGHVLGDGLLIMDEGEIMAKEVSQ